MIRILLFFLALVFAFCVGPIILENQGFALFVVSGYRIEMSLASLLFLLVSSILLLCIFLSLIKKVFHSKHWLSSWLFQKKQNRAQRLLEKAQLSLLEDNYTQAFEFFSQTSKHNSNKVLFHLFSAKQYLNQNELNLAAKALEKASELATRKESFVLTINLIHFQLKKRDYEKSRQLIDSALASNPKHPQLIKLAYTLYSETREYKRIIDLLPIMHNIGLYDDLQFAQQELQARINLIKQLATSEKIDELTSWWNNQPKKIKIDTLYHNILRTYLVPLANHKQVNDLLATLNHL